MNTNRHVRLVVAWADILHATAHYSLPRLKVPQYTTHCQRQRLKDVVQQHRYSYSCIVGRDHVPAYFREVLEDLETLATAKSLLVKNTVSNQRELRPIFSSLLIMTEHRILELGRTAASFYSVSSNSALEDISYVEAVKAAALIFTFHGLRDITITAAYFDSLIQRLRDGLCDMFNHFFQHKNPASISDKVVAVPFLLWLCMNGWKASTIKTRATSREFFVEKAARLCESARIDTLDKLSSHICGIIFMAEYYMPACSGLWADIKTWTAPRGVQRT